MAGLAPADDGFFNKPCLRIMLREQLGLAVRKFRVMSCERFGDPGMQLPWRPALQGAVGGILDQCMLEQV